MAASLLEYKCEHAHLQTIDQDMVQANLEKSPPPTSRKGAAAVYSRKRITGIFAATVCWGFRVKARDAYCLPQPLSSFASSLFCSPPYSVVFHPLIFCQLTIQKLYSSYWSHPYLLTILTPWEILTSKRLGGAQGENDPPSQGFVCL